MTKDTKHEKAFAKSLARMLSTSRKIGHEKATNAFRKALGCAPTKVSLAKL
jgi:hypothetical protein